jgi:hypothetical protein
MLPCAAFEVEVLISSGTILVLVKRHYLSFGQAALGKAATDRA